MTKAVALVVPGSLDLRTGGYIYDRHIVDGLRSMAWTVDVQLLDDSFPRPTTAARLRADEVFAAFPAGTITIVDSLALGAIPEIIERHQSRLRIVALVHLPLAADIGIDAETASRFAAAERRAFAAVALIIATGRATLPLLERYDISSSKVIVIEPGTDPAPVARGSGAAQLHLLSVATLNPGKGHTDLLSALAQVPSRNWRLTCAGDVTRHPSTVAAVRRMIRELQLDDRVSLAGELDSRALEERYVESDGFVLATLRETYGMAVAEALAHGLPVVSTMTGAIPELVRRDAGLLVSPGDIGGLRDALTQFIGDPDLRVRLAAGARRVRQFLRRWDETIASMAAALESIDHA